MIRVVGNFVIHNPGMVSKANCILNCFIPYDPVEYGQYIGSFFLPPEAIWLTVIIDGMHALVIGLIRLGPRTIHRVFDTAVVIVSMISLSVNGTIWITFQDSAYVQLVDPPLKCFFTERSENVILLPMLMSKLVGFGTEAPTGASNILKLFSTDRLLDSGLFA